MLSPHSIHIVLLTPKEKNSKVNILYQGFFSLSIMKGVKIYVYFRTCNRDPLQ